MITREQCLKWAEEAGFDLSLENEFEEVCIELLCQQVWAKSRNAALEKAAMVCEEHPEGMNMLGGNFVACADAIRKLKVTP